jgi:membrane protease YdiL (CAAX protease family)
MLKEEKPSSTDQSGSRFARHPWRALLVMLGIQPLCYVLVGLVLYGIFRLPKDLSNMEAFSTVTLFTVGGFLAYVIAPFFLRIPMGKRTFMGYLDDIRLTRTRPFFRLLLLTLSCDLILILCQGTGSIVYRLSEGNPVTTEFIFRVFDLSSALPPKSVLLYAQFFSMFEEVAFRGVLLTMLLENKYSQRKAIIFSALAFGLMHLPGVFSGQTLIFTLGQVVWAFLFALFYGYLFIKSGSLLPPMIIHWLSNVFQAPLTAYWQTAPDAINAMYGVVFGYGLAAFLLIMWVRFFTARWLSAEFQRHERK